MDVYVSVSGTNSDFGGDFRANKQVSVWDQSDWFLKRVDDSTTMRALFKQNLTTIPKLNKTAGDLFSGWAGQVFVMVHGGWVLGLEYARSDFDWVTSDSVSGIARLQKVSIFGEKRFQVFTSEVGIGTDFTFPEVRLLNAGIKQDTIAHEIINHGDVVFKSGLGVGLSAGLYQHVTPWLEVFFRASWQKAVFDKVDLLEIGSLELTKSIYLEEGTYQVGLNFRLLSEGTDED